MSHVLAAFSPPVGFEDGEFRLCILLWQFLNSGPLCLRTEESVGGSLINTICHWLCWKNCSSSAASHHTATRLLGTVWTSILYMKHILKPGIYFYTVVLLLILNKFWVLPVPLWTTHDSVRTSDPDWYRCVCTDLMGQRRRRGQSRRRNALPDFSPDLQGNDYEVRKTITSADASSGSQNYF